MVLNVTPLRALIFGTGSIGRRHIANLQALRPDTVFAFVRADLRRDALAEELGAEVLADAAAGLAWQPDLAIIATPSDLHGPALAAMLDAGIACLIEKPVVTRAEEAAALQSRPASSLPPTQVGCVLRFLPVVEQLQQWVRSGRLGRIARASLQCGQYLPDWRPGTDYRQCYSADAARGGGVIFDLVHELDLAVSLFGNCTLRHVLAERRSTLELDCEDVALLHLSGEAGEPIAIALDYVSRNPARTIQIVGEEATATLDFIGRSLVLQGPDGVIESTGEGFDAAAAYRLQLEELLAAMAGGPAPRLPLHEGLRATHLAIEAHSQARTQLANRAEEPTP